MRRTPILEKSLGQLASQHTVPICRSCRLPSVRYQRRQIQSTARQNAASGLTDRFKSALFGKKDSTNGSESVLDVVGNRSAAARKRKEAVVELPAGWSESPDKDPNYIEATTWDNLERVGSDSWVEGQFDTNDSYEGWTKLNKQRKYEVQEADQVLLPIVSEVLSAKGLALPTEGNAWSRYKLSDPAIKFEIAKLVLQKEGVRFSDYAVNRADTLNDIRQLLITKPEPKKLAQRLQEGEEIKELANVQVHSRRVTPIDKEKAVGRWKIIEQELIDRGLPVTGHSGRVKKVEAGE